MTEICAHAEFIGIGNEIILENARKTAARKIPMIIRVPVIPGFNDSKKEIEEIAKFTAELKWVKEINLLPYHSLGKHKFDLLGKKFSMGNVPALSSDNVRELLNVCESFGLSAKVV